MGFSNPAQPIDYDLIAQLVGDIAINYTQVRNACEDALASTDAAIANLQTTANGTATAAALSAVSTAVANVQSTVNTLATSAALAAVNTAVGNVLTAVNTRQPAPTVPSWTATRNGNLAAMAVIQLAIDAVSAERTAALDNSAAAVAVTNDLNARRSALWALVKTP